MQADYLTPFKLLLVEESTTQIEARETKVKIYLISTAIKVYMKRVLVILFHHRDTVHNT